MMRWTTKIIFIILVLFYFTVSLQSQAWEKLTKKDRPTFQEIQKAAYQFFEGIKETAGRKPGFKQFKRWEWFTRTRLDKDGYFDPSLNWKGWLEKEERFGPARDAGGFWTSLGPDKKPGLIGLGRLNCIEFDPHDTDIIWVGAPTGGLWKSSDAGQTWSTNTDQLPNIGVSDILIHPGDSNIMYIATGDKQRGSMLSFGVMKSVDGGETWQFTGLNPEVTEKCKIGKILMHPGDPETILAATNKGIYKTTNGGDTWENKIPGDFFDIEVHPLNSSIWYASRAATGVYRSLDSGQHWTPMTNGLPSPGPDIGRIAISLCKFSPHVLYAVYSQDVVGLGWQWGLYGIYRTNDGGNTWKRLPSPPNLLGWSETGTDTGGQGGYALIHDVNPENPDEVYVGSVHIWKSIDGGVRWNIISLRVHVDHHDFAFLPGSPNTVFSCHDGGLAKSTDYGANWVDLSNGLGIHQVYRLGISKQDPNMLIIGAQDNASAILNGEWRSVGDGDGTSCFIDPNDTSYLYFSWQFSRLYRSSNGGRSYRQIFFRNDAAWIAPVVMDPLDSTTLYTATTDIYLSNNRGSSWERISNFRSPEPIRILATTLSTSGYIYASDGKRLFNTPNSGNSWRELDTDGIPDFITGIAVHPQNSDILWVTVGGYGRWNSRFTWFNIPYEIDKPKVFYSENSGTTWTDVSGLLPNIPVNCIAIASNPFGVYVGTDLGVFYSPSGLGDWQRYDNGLPNVIVTDMEIQKGAGKIVAATYGRGVWQSPLATEPSTLGLFPPLRFLIRTDTNQSLIRTERINILTWKPNSFNGQKVLYYRVYQVFGNTWTLLGQVDGNTFEYVHRRIGTGTYRYALSAVDAQGHESEPLYLTFQVD